MERKGSVGLLMGCLMCMLITLPSFVYADVTINTAETSTVDLEGVNTTAGRNAYVTSPGSVIITGSNTAIWASVDGWSINVASGRTVSSSGGYGVLFDDAPGGGQYTPLSGTLHNHGIISGTTGVFMGSGTIDNYGSITGTTDDGIYIGINGMGNQQIINYTGKSIVGHTSGIYIDSGSLSDSVYISNSGTITGTETAGINFQGHGTINVFNNTGAQINSADGTGILINNTLLGTVNVTNSAGGSITGGANGGRGIQISNTGETRVTNSGTISGSTGYGIDLQGIGNKRVDNNGGLISGLIGIVSEDSYSPTVIFNSGTITGTATSEKGEVAISLYGAGVLNQVTLETGSVINGYIETADGTENSIILDGHGTIRAEQFHNFNNLDKTGAGTWILTGDGYSGGKGGDFDHITVTTGVLALAARGVGGGVVVRQDFMQMPGASLGFVVTATGDTGGLTVRGGGTAVADFNNGTIVVIPKAGSYAKTTTYGNVLTADIIFNKWTQVTGTAFLSPSLVETGPGTKVYDLILTRLSFSQGPWPSLGISLDGMYEDATGDMRTILDELIALGPGAAQTALSQLGGGTHTAFQFLSFYGLNKYHGALNNHLGGGSGFLGGGGRGMAANQYDYPQSMQMAVAAGGNTLSDAAPILLAMAGNGGQLASGTNWDLWIDGYYSQGDRRSDDLISKYKQTLYGTLMGFDYRVTDKLLIGVSAGISQTDVKFDNLLDEGRQDSYQGSVYAYYDGKPWYAEGVLTYGYNKYKMDRWITTGGTWLANSEYKGNEYSGYAEVGYKYDAGGGVVISPMAAFQAAYLMQDGYTETGADDLNLIVDSRNTGSYQSYLGLHISKAIALGNFVLTPDARAKWAHEFSPDDHLINAKFSSAGSGSFTVEADRPSRDTAIVGVGLTGRFNKNLSIYIQYDAELNKDYTNHTGMMGLRLAW